MGLMNRVRRGLAELIKPEDEAPPAAAARTPPPTPKAPVRPAGGFDTQLADLLGHTGSGAVHAGRINLIGLERIKEQFGANWARIADRAERIARSTIERHLVPGDIFTSVQGMHFIIVFGSLPRREAQLKCVLMAREIARALLGDEGASELEVRTAVAKLDGTLGFATVPTIDELLSSPAFDELSVADYSLDKAAEELEAVPIAAPSAAPVDVLKTLRFAYRPMWSPTHSVISAYLCVPLVMTSDVGPIYGEASQVIGGDIEETVRLDFAVLLHVLSELQTVVREQRHLLVTLPVHFETLCSSVRRTGYARELAAGLTPEATRLLVIEVVGVPDGVPQSRMAELLTPLRPHCRALTARVRLEVTDFSALKVMGILSIGCDITDNSAPELVIMQRLGRFARAGEKARLGTHIRGVRSISLLAAALGAGFRYIDGDAVSPLVDRPRQILKFTLADAYRPVVRA
jgi:hypothetical protein